MPICTQCKIEIPDGDEKTLHTKVVCAECYIDAVVPGMPKAHYNNDAEFMNRLKDSYSVHKQKYD